MAKLLIRMSAIGRPPDEDKVTAGVRVCARPIPAPATSNTNTIKLRIMPAIPAHFGPPAKPRFTIIDPTTFSNL